MQADAQMMADISRHAPLDPASQATHDATEYESEKLLPLIDAALTAQHDSGSGAELVREVERVRDESGPRWTAHALVQRWDRLRAALLDGDAAREDAERYRTLREMTWDSSPLAVVQSPKDAVKLGHDCPSRDRLDAAIDRARGGK